MPDPLSLSDRLAAERTHLANERTLLAYLRTALALLAAGLALFYLYDDPAAVTGGVALIPLGALVLALGLWRFRRVRRRLRDAGTAEHDLRAPRTP